MNKVVQETLEILDNWSTRLDGHCSQKRSQERSEYRQLIRVYVPRGEFEHAEKNEIAVVDDHLGMIMVTGRNLSRSGVSFLHSQNLMSENIIVGLMQDRKNCIYLESEVVRRRQVHNGLWEFGVLFHGRAMM